MSKRKQLGRKRDLFAVAMWLPKAREMYEDGLSFASVGRRVGISRAAVHMMLHRYYPKMRFRPVGSYKAKP